MCSGISWPNIFTKFLEHVDCKTHTHAIIEDLKIGLWENIGNGCADAVVRTSVLDPFLFKEKYPKPFLNEWAIFSGILPKDGVIKDDGSVNDQTKFIIMQLDSIAYYVYHMLQTLNSLAANCSFGRALLKDHKKLYESLKSIKDSDEAVKCIENNQIFNIVKSCIPDSLNSKEKGIAFAICFTIFFIVHNSGTDRQADKPLTADEEKLKRQGNDFYDLTQYRDAILSYTKIMKTNKYNSIVYSNRAQSYIKLGIYNRSVLDSFRVIVLRPGWCKGYCRLATSLGEQNNVHAAHTVANWGLNVCEKLSHCNDYISLRDTCDQLNKSCLETGTCSDGSNTDKKEDPLLKMAQKANSLEIPDLVSDSDEDNDNTIIVNNPQKKDSLKINETPEVKFSMPNLLDLIKEQKKHLQAGSLLIIADKGCEAIPHYQKALDIVPLFQQQNYDIEPKDLLVLKYALGIAHVENGYEDLKKALQLFEEIHKDNSNVFLAVYYSLSDAFVKLFRFDEATKHIENGLAIASKTEVFSTYNWPGTDVVIEHTIPERLKVALSKLVNLCKVAPDALCRFDFCAFGKKMYFGNPEYKGLYQVNCIAHCKLDYHPQCWKLLRNKMKLSEKEFLDQICLTPDCGNFIVTVLKIDRLGNTEKNFMSDVQRPKSSKLRKSKLERKFEQKELRKTKKSEKIIKIAEGEAVEIPEPVVEDKINEDENATLEPPVPQSSKSICDKPVANEKLPTKNEIAPNYEVHSTPLYVIKKDEPEQDDMKTVNSKQTKKIKKKRKKTVMSAEEFCGAALADNIHMQRVNRLQEQKTKAEEGFIPDPRYKPLPITLSGLVEGEANEYPFHIPQHLREDMSQMENHLENFPRLTVSDEDKSIAENICSLFEGILEHHGSISRHADLLVELTNDFPAQAKALIQEYGGIVDFLLMNNNKFQLVFDDICLVKDTFSTNNPFKFKLDTLDDFELGYEDWISESSSDSEGSDDDDEDDDDDDSSSVIEKNNSQPETPSVECTESELYMVNKELALDKDVVDEELTPEVDIIDKESTLEKDVVDKEFTPSHGIIDKELIPQDVIGQELTLQENGIDQEFTPLVDNVFQDLLQKVDTLMDNFVQNNVEDFHLEEEKNMKELTPENSIGQELTAEDLIDKTLTSEDLNRELTLETNVIANELAQEKDISSTINFSNTSNMTNVAVPNYNEYSENNDSDNIIEVGNTSKSTLYTNNVNDNIVGSENCDLISFEIVDNVEQKQPNETAQYDISPTNKTEIQNLSSETEVYHSLPENDDRQRHLLEASENNIVVNNEDNEGLFETFQTDVVEVVLPTPVSAVEIDPSFSVPQLQEAAVTLPDEEKVELISGILNALSDSVPDFFGLLNSSLNGMEVIQYHDTHSQFDMEEKEREHQMELQKLNEIIRSLEDRLTTSFDSIAKLRKTFTLERKGLDEKVNELKSCLQVKLAEADEIQAAHDAERKRWQQERLKAQESLKTEKESAAKNINLLKEIAEKYKLLEEEQKRTNDVRIQLGGSLSHAVEEANKLFTRVKKAETLLIQNIKATSMENLDEQITQLKNYLYISPKAPNAPALQEKLKDLEGTKAKHEGEIAELLRRVSQSEEIDLDTIPKIDRMVVNKGLSSSELQNHQSSHNMYQAPILNNSNFVNVTSQNYANLYSQLRPPLQPNYYSPLLMPLQNLWAPNQKSEVPVSVPSYNASQAKMFSNTAPAVTSYSTPSSLATGITATSGNTNGETFSAGVKPAAPYLGNLYRPITYNENVINKSTLPQYPLSNNTTRTSQQDSSTASVKPPTLAATQQNISTASAKPATLAASQQNISTASATSCYNLEPVSLLGSKPVSRVRHNIPIVIPPDVVRPSTNMPADKSDVSTQSKMTTLVKQNPSASVPQFKQKPSAAAPQVRSFERLKQMTGQCFPQLSSNDIEKYIMRYRSKKQKLSGMNIDDLVAGIATLIESETSYLRKKTSNASTMGLDSIPSTKGWQTVTQTTEWKNSGNTDDNCSICLENIPNHENFKADCGHMFHEKCMNPWLKTKSTCPVCRKYILLADEFPAL